ncbi:hypothetical protein LINGRAPRIM_LOCUS2367, partial [Linum grandiflorum]
MHSLFEVPNLRLQKVDQPIYEEKSLSKRDVIDDEGDPNDSSKSSPASTLFLPIHSLDSSIYSVLVSRIAMVTLTLETVVASDVDRES